QSLKLLAVVDVSMCSERYAEERPLGLRKYQLPPTSSLASKQVCRIPQSPSAFIAVRPLTPAPITQTFGFPRMTLSLCAAWGSPRASLAGEHRQQSLELDL